MQMIHSSRLLRAALGLDAAACAAMGMMLCLASEPLAGLFGLPELFLRGAGLVLLPCAAVLAWFARHMNLPRIAVLAVIGVNLIWIADSVAILLVGWFVPTGLGTGFVLVQAAAVTGITLMEAEGLRRSTACELSPSATGRTAR